MLAAGGDTRLYCCWSGNELAISTPEQRCVWLVLNIRSTGPFVWKNARHIRRKGEHLLLCIAVILTTSTLRVLTHQEYSHFYAAVLRSGLVKTTVQLLLVPVLLRDPVACI